MMSWALTNDAHVYAVQGRFEESTDVLSRQDELIPDLSGGEKIRTLGLQIFLLIASGANDLRALRETADHAARLIGKTGPIHLHCIEAYAAVVAARMLLWKRAGGQDRAGTHRREITTSLAVLAQAARVFPVTRPRYLLMHGEWAYLRGKKDQAASAWKRAGDVARRLEMPYECACARQTFVDHLPSRTAEASAALVEAQSIFGRLGERSRVIGSALG
jgi:hypothetical protein